jgi:hypothetical protein
MTARSTAMKMPTANPSRRPINAPTSAEGKMTNKRKRRAEVIGHGDLFWTNVIFRDGQPVALIDWEIARPMTRVLEVALAATYWAGVRIDAQLSEWGLPLDRRGERLRLLCDSYGLDQARRAVLFEELIEHRQKRLEQREWRGVVPRTLIVANLDWTVDHAPHLSSFLA